MTDEYEAALAYLMAKQYPEDRWILESGQQWFRVNEVAPQLGVTEFIIRTAAESGRIPGAVLHGQQAGWRLPRSGIIIYLTTLRQEQERRSGHTG